MNALIKHTFFTLSTPSIAFKANMPVRGLILCAVNYRAKGRHSICVNIHRKKHNVGRQNKVSVDLIVKVSVIIYSWDKNFTPEFEF